MQANADTLRDLSPNHLRQVLEGLGPTKVEQLSHDWKFWARPTQLAPEGDWNTWFINAGRGFGKTRAGVEWVREQVKLGKKRIAAVASTNSDIERVMVKGESGFLAVCWKGDKTYKGKELGFPEWSPTKRTLTWENGAKVEFYSAEEPERLRGPQFEAAWCFTGGTQVLTPTGNKSVENLVSGDTVVTSQGVRSISHVMKRPMPVGVVTFSDGISLEGTEEHPIYTNRGWVPLGSLEEGDVVWKMSGTKVKNTTLGVMDTTQTVVKGSTGLSEETSTDSLKGLTSTTSTVTSLTTTLTISKDLQDQNTLSYTTVNEVSLEENPLGVDRFLATVAEQSLNGRLSNHQGYIVRSVNTEEQKKDVKSHESVNNAVRVSNQEWESSVVKVVSIWQPTGVKTVHNLRVEGTHEYYANGILTHNCDELGAWNKDEGTWDMLQFCLRLGKHPKVCVTTTPRPTRLVRKLTKNPTTHITTGSTFDNAANLAGTYLEAVKAQYEGTRLGRQELYAEILEEAEGALWTTETLDNAQIDLKDVPVLNRIVVALDPAVTANAESDMTGIMVAGVDVNNKGYILADYTDKLSPEGWAQKAVELYHQYHADRIVAEVNQGGDMVKTTLRGVDETVPYKAVRASRGKYARAEPISALYERGLVYHVRNPEDGQNLNELETQMRTWEPLGSIGSPDRLDACVWALTELMLNGYARPELKLAHMSKKGIAR